MKKDLSEFIEWFDVVEFDIDGVPKETLPGKLCITISIPVDGDIEKAKQNAIKSLKIFIKNGICLEE